MAIFVAAILFLIAIGTFYSWELDLDQNTVADHIDHPPTIPWGAQAGAEAVLGFAFLIPGVVMISRKNS